MLVYIDEFIEDGEWRLNIDIESSVLFFLVLIL